MNDSNKLSAFLGGAAALVVALLGFVGFVVSRQVPVAPVQPVVVLPQQASSQDATLGGLIHNIQESFDAGIAVDGTEVITGTGTLKLGSGTAIDKHVRTTATVNPNSIAAGQSTTTVVTLTGASSSDHCLVNVTSGDLLGTTSTAVLACRAGTDSATVYYYNATATSAFDAGSSVLSVQAWSY